MGRLVPKQQSSFNSGELSPRLLGRGDLALYAAGCREMTNFLPTIQGVAVRRSGTRHVAQGKLGGAVRMIPFRFNEAQAYVIEATALTFRFYTNDYRIETVPGVAYEVATPYLSADLRRLNWQQSADVLYLVDGVRQPRKLTRTGALTFALAAQVLSGGPFNDRNRDKTITVQASAATGSVTLTASSAIWTAGHVGGLFEMEVEDFRSIPAWEPAIEVTAGDKRRSDGKVYRANALPPSGSKRTGNVQPTHTSGMAWDGMGVGDDINAKKAGGVQWEFLYSKTATLRITAFASGTSVTATVLDRLPDELVTTPSWRWAQGAFSDAEGWPDLVTIWQGRLWFFMQNRFFASVVGDFDNFARLDESGAIQPDLAIVGRLDSTAPILWVAADRVLLLGTDDAEQALAPINAAEAVSAINIRRDPQTYHGSSAVRPAQAVSATLFVTKAGNRIRELKYEVQRDKYIAPDVTLRGEHLVKPGILELAWVQEPESLLFALRSDGQIVSLTYDGEAGDGGQEVRGLARQVVAGTAARVESMAAIPAPDGSHDQLWLAATRTVGGVPTRHIERLERPWKDGDVQADAFFVDAGLSYAGAPATMISGLTHLVGETLEVLADGARHPDCTVDASGQIVLQRPASKVQAGLGWKGRIRPMPLDLSAEAPPHVRRRIVRAAVRLTDSLGVLAGDPNGPMDALSLRAPVVPMGEAPPLVSGVIEGGWQAAFDLEANALIQTEGPLPCTLNSIMFQVEVGQQ